MVDVTVLPGFLAVILLFLAPPGPDMAYMVAVGLEGGRRAAIKAILGIGTGMSVYAAAVVIGVGKLVQSEPSFLEVIKLLGATYLLWLAFTTLRHARAAPSHATSQESAPKGRWYVRGLLVAITNPKIMLFFLAVLPGFTGDAESTVLQLTMLGAVNVSTEVLLYGGIGVLAGTFHERFSGSQRSSVVMNYVAGTVYLCLAIVIGGEALLG